MLSTHSYPDRRGISDKLSSLEEVLLLEGWAEDVPILSEWILEADLSDNEDEDIPAKLHKQTRRLKL